MGVGIEHAAVGKQLKTFLGIFKPEWKCGGWTQSSLLLRGHEWVKGELPVFRGSSDRSSLLLLRTLLGLEQITRGGWEPHLKPQHIQHGLCRHRCVWSWCPSQLCSRLTYVNLCPSLFQAFKLGFQLLNYAILGFPGLSCESWCACLVVALVLTLCDPGLAGPFLLRSVSCRSSLCLIYRVWRFRGTP